MTADDLTRLRAVAEAAMPGYVYPEESNADATEARLRLRFRNTFHPAVVLALIDRVERAERERDLLQTEVNTWIENDQISFARATRLDDEITALRAAVEGLADECDKVQPATAELNAWQRAHAAFARTLRGLLTEGADDGQ